MKQTMKKSLWLLAATAILLSLLCGCGGNDKTPGGDNQTPGTTAAPADGYRVKVVDALGAPYTEGVVVQYMQNGQSAGMQVVGADGTATKSLPDGEYTVELSFTATNQEYYYDASDLKLTPDSKEGTVVLARKAGAEPTPLYVENAEKKAYAVWAGCTYVTLKKGERNYFLFAPTEAGVYEFSMPDSDAAVGYYGAPHFVQSLHAGDEIVDGKFTVTIRADMISTDNTGTTVMVLGVDAGNNENATLAIRRAGDPEVDETEGPWSPYAGTHVPKDYSLPAGTSLHKVDITAKSFEIVLGDDGYYHKDTKDGPLMYLRFKGTDYVTYDDILNNFHIGAYLYNEDGSFLRKEEYTELMEKYRDCADKATNAYPLTEDLVYILKNYGKHQGWWDTEHPGYLFHDADDNKIPGINLDIAWMFALYYA